MPSSEPAAGILALWSAPRCRSTAFFRMMIERGDFTNVHEPFAYLTEFGFSEVDGVRATNEREVIDALRRLAGHGPVFFKNTMDERYPGVLADTDFLARDARHVFLIRHPRETIASYHALDPGVKQHQIGFETEYELFEAVRRHTDEQPLVIDADDLMADPEGIIRVFCDRVGIDFRPEALAWRPESRSEWLPSQEWHLDVDVSSGFHAPEKDDYVDVEAHPVLSGYLAHHLPYYSELRARRVRL
ncbi:sulfotransferase family protein [Streptomyces atroolivaceus]|uniref:Sulfotransferase family protein n=1 Tax=Streptomyces atroolivaceus TaxID=66869 RepID=A0ABV9VK52_STRAZ|nr:sulfotransferase family protein [Streptomyces atroolivaceus]